MAVGKGKYDDLCTQARETAGATSAILIIFDGSQGTGFSCQLEPRLLPNVPNILRQLADKMEGDVRRDVREISEAN